MDRKVNRQMCLFQFWEFVKDKIKLNLVTVNKCVSKAKCQTYQKYSIINKVIYYSILTNYISIKL